MKPGRKRLCRVCEDELPEGYGFGRCNGCGILQGLDSSGDLVQTVHGGEEAESRLWVRSLTVQGAQGDALGVQGAQGDA